MCNIFSKQKTLECLYIIKGLNKASLRIAQNTNNIEEFQRTSKLNEAINVVNYRIKHDLPISKNGQNMINQFPSLIKKYHITPHTIQVLKDMGVLK